jgi:chemotaxis-related protein WspB
VDVTRVVEVVPRVDLRRLPHAPGYLVGLFDYRGTVVPVIDLSILLGQDACRDRLSTRVILVDIHPGARDQGARSDPPHPADNQAAPSRRWLVGLIAEQVSDVASIRPEQVISPPLNLSHAPYLGAIVDVGHVMTQLLVVDRLLDRSFRKAFFEGESNVDEGANSNLNAVLES